MHCALVKILAPETLLDTDEFLLLGVVLGTYCTRYLDIYFSSLAGPSLVGEWFVDEEINDVVVITEPEVSTRG